MIRLAFIAALTAFLLCGDMPYWSGCATDAECEAADETVTRLVEP